MFSPRRDCALPQCGIATGLRRHKFRTVPTNECAHFASLQKLQITKRTALTSVRINDRGKPMMTGNGRINGKPPCQSAMTRQSSKTFYAIYAGSPLCIVGPVNCTHPPTHGQRGQTYTPVCAGKLSRLTPTGLGSDVRARAHTRTLMKPHAGNNPI